MAEDIKPRRFRGKGKKPAKTVQVHIRVTLEEREVFLKLGGSKAFRRWLKESAKAE